LQRTQKCVILSASRLPQLQRKARSNNPSISIPNTSLRNYPMRTEGGEAGGEGGSWRKKGRPTIICRARHPGDERKQQARDDSPSPLSPCPLPPVSCPPIALPHPPQPPSWSLAIFTFALQIRGGGKRDRGFCARRFARRDAINERRSVRGRRAPAVYTCYTLARTFPPAARYNPLTINKVLMKWNIRRHVQASPSIRQRTMSRLLAAPTEEFHAPRESIVACGIIVASSWSSGRT